MNSRTTYELTISEKLQHLPLPDLEEAIWTRVKTQLDIDMPSDESGSNGPDAPSGSGWTWGAGAFILITALVAVFLVLKKSNQQPIQEPANPVQTTPSSTPVPQNKTDSSRGIKNNVFISAPPLNSGTAPPSFAAPPGDSVAVVSDNRLPAADSLQQTIVESSLPAVVDTTRPKPKTRGVTGITDNDYRIVPAKKDSL